MHFRSFASRYQVPHLAFRQKHFAPNRYDFRSAIFVAGGLKLLVPKTQAPSLRRFRGTQIFMAFEKHPTPSTKKKPARIKVSEVTPELGARGSSEFSCSSRYRLKCGRHKSRPWLFEYCCLATASITEFDDHKNETAGVGAPRTVNTPKDTEPDSIRGPDGDFVSS